MRTNRSVLLPGIPAALAPENPSGAGQTARQQYLSQTGFAARQEAPFADPFPTAPPWNAAK